MYLGIEIGGTKLQLGVGYGDGSALLELERQNVASAPGAEGIREQIEQLARGILDRYPCQAIGIGFGGPVDAAAGTVVKSHHVTGWADFPLRDWCHETLGLPARVENDADTAGFAEALFGAGKGANPVLYVTVGTGIGGGLIVDGEIYRGSGLGAAEIGHLRPGLDATDAAQHLESRAAGWGIAARARARIESVAGSSRDLVPEDDASALDLFRRCGEDPCRLTTATVATAAGEGNTIAREVIAEATDHLGWGLAQAITISAPQVVVVGGGVSLMGEVLFLGPVRDAVARYVFPPFANRYRVEPAALGEEVVVHGALALARRTR